MEVIFEKLIGNGENQEFVRCSKTEATHVHYCGNDENKPCKRITIAEFEAQQ